MHYDFYYNLLNSRIVKIISPTLLARILTLLISNSSVTLLSSSLQILNSIIPYLLLFLSPFKLHHKALYSSSSCHNNINISTNTNTGNAGSSSSDHILLDYTSQAEFSLHDIEALLQEFESIRRSSTAAGQGQNVYSPRDSSPFSPKNKSNNTNDNEISNSNSNSSSSNFLRPTALLTCLYTPYYTGRGALIDHTFVIDIDRCQILSNPIGQEAILLTLEPCYLHNLVSRINQFKLKTTIENLNHHSTREIDINIISNFKYFLIESILRFIPSHLVHFPYERVIGLDVENFFREIDVDDAKQLYDHKSFNYQKEACSRALPRSKAFYYSFVDSPYFFDLLIEHGKACSIDYMNYMDPNNISKDQIGLREI